MSPAMGSTTSTIHIPLQDEGVAVSRPTEAVPLPSGAFLVLATADYDSGTEAWAFLPGSKVVCTVERKGGRDILVATGLAPVLAAAGRSAGGYLVWP